MGDRKILHLIESKKSKGLFPGLKIKETLYYRRTLFSAFKNSKKQTFFQNRTETM